MKELTDFQEKLARNCPDIRILYNEPMAKHTSFRIGGAVEAMAFPKDKEELAQLLKTSRLLDCNPAILGAGTNVLAPDEGMAGLVICLKDCLDGMERLDETHIRVMAGVTMTRAAMFAAKQGLSGLEFAHGIPGTVGGGIYMNAGAYGGELKDVAVRTEFMALDGNSRWLEGETQGFSYRNSAFQSMEGVIVRTEFALIPGCESEIREKIHELAQKRRASQPLELPSAGSTFKRPKTGYAAALIEEAGLKGLSVGGAAVSEKHAGFVVNKGGATAADVLALVKLVQQRVFDASGVHLEPEVRLWGAEDAD